MLLAAHAEESKRFASRVDDLVSVIRDTLEMRVITWTDGVFAVRHSKSSDAADDEDGFLVRVMEMQWPILLTGRNFIQTAANLRLTPGIAGQVFAPNFEIYAVAVVFPVQVSVVAQVVRPLGHTL